MSRHHCPYKIDIFKKFRRNMFLLYFAVYFVLYIGSASSKPIEGNHKMSMVLFNQINNALEFLNRAIANLEWQTLKNSSIIPTEVHTSVFQLKLKWKNRWCVKLTNLRDNGMFVDRKLISFLCNGPKYTDEMARKTVFIKNLLSFAYDAARICKIENYNWTCYNGESDVAKLMSTSRNEGELRWAWIAWRNRMSFTRQLFAQLVDLENAAARNNGYSDIGAYWREEFDIPNLERVFEEMYQRVESLYRLLHAVVRFRLAKLYPDIVDTFQPIPAHLLGNLWSQSWETLIDVVFPNYNVIMLNLKDTMRRDNYNVMKIVKKTEEFYTSLGFPPLTSEFWRNSIFEEKTDRISSCHATAINMYKKNDFRIFACLETKPQDFYVINHEMGHIQYYMAYQNRSPIFKNGINTAFHESIGDAVLYGAASFRHMQRLGLIRNAFKLPNDSSCDASLETAVLLRQALLKIPQLSSGLIIEKWRWSVFSGKIKPSRYNAEWWKLHRRYMGIAPPSPRSEEFFDPAAKFHVAHDTPYAGYYLGSFLQVQLFQGMCEASKGLKIGSMAFDSLLHKCDIYGSKNATKFLRSVMELGSSLNWRDALYIITGHAEYRVDPLLAYYEPVREWLQCEIQRHNISVGWN